MIAMAIAGLRLGPALMRGRDDGQAGSGKMEMGGRALVWLYSSRERPGGLLASSRARQLPAHGRDKRRRARLCVRCVPVHAPPADAELSQRPAQPAACANKSTKPQAVAGRWAAGARALWGWFLSAEENKTFCCVHELRAYFRYGFGFSDVSPSSICRCCHGRGVRHVRVPRESSSSWSREKGGRDQVAQRWLYMCPRMWICFIVTKV